MFKMFKRIVEIMCDLLHKDISVWGINVRRKCIHSIGTLISTHVYEYFKKDFEEKKYNEIDSKVRTLFEGLLCEEDIKNILFCIRCLEEETNSFKKNYNFLIEHFSRKKCSDLSVEQWCVLATILNMSGLFKLALICREFAQEAILTLPHYKNAHKLKFACCFEQGNLKGMSLYWDKLKKRPFGHSEAKMLYPLLVKLLTEKKSLDCFKATEFYLEEYVKRISEEEILILGPAPGNQTILLHNEGVIVGFNWRKETVQWETFKKESIKISAYLGETLAKLNENISDEENLLHRLDYIACNKSCKHLVESNKFLNYDLPINMLMMWGDLNKVQKILLHTCLCAQKAVNIKNVTLYLGEKVYADAYVRDNETRKNQEEAHYAPFGSHDPVTNFIFLKIFYEAGLIKPDTALKNILEKTTKQYIVELEEQYHNKSNFKD